MAQISYEALGRQGALGFVAFLFVVQFFMGISLLIAASRQLWAFSRDGALPFSSYIRHVVSSSANGTVDASRQVNHREHSPKRMATPPFAPSGSASSSPPSWACYVL